MSAFAQTEAEPATADEQPPLASYTRRILRQLAGAKDGLPVRFRAFVSPRAPRKYVSTIQTLRRVLAEIDKQGGKQTEVTVTEVEAYSPEAVTAYTQLNCNRSPSKARSPESSRASTFIAASFSRIRTAKSACHFWPPVTRSSTACCGRCCR